MPWLLEIAFVLFFAMGWFPCCCSAPTTVTCGACPASLASAEYELALSGVTNSGCTNCGSLWDGTYILAVDPNSCSTNGANCVGSLDRCCWLYDFTANYPPHKTGFIACANLSARIVLCISEFFSQFVSVSFNVGMSSNPPLQSHLFRQTGAINSIDCDALSAYNVPYNSSIDNTTFGLACNMTAATCTLTSL